MLLLANSFSVSILHAAATDTLELFDVGRVLSGRKRFTGNGD